MLDVELRSYSLERPLDDCTVVVHLVAELPIHALVYVESLDGSVLACWTGRYLTMFDVWEDAQGRVTV